MTDPHSIIADAVGGSQLWKYRDYDEDFDYFICVDNASVIRIRKHEVVTVFAPRNTFSLFQKFGGLDLSWCEVGQYGKQCSRPICRCDAAKLVRVMTIWLASSEADQEVVAAGTDHQYVQVMIDEIASLLAPDGTWLRNEPWSYITAESFGNDDRELDGLCALADAYSDHYWGSCADH